MYVCAILEESQKDYSMGICALLESKVISWGTIFTKFYEELKQTLIVSNISIC